MTPDCDPGRRVFRLDPSAFEMLHPQGRDLIKGWAALGAQRLGDMDPSACFEGFIYVWFAVNGWGSCVSGSDHDRGWVNAVAADGGISHEFMRMRNTDEQFAAVTQDFAELWPVFKSSEIRRRRIAVVPGVSRADRIRTYLDSNVPFEPSCWLSHNQRERPMDWMHTFKTLYRVRCNLFHGEKTLDSENDRNIVQRAHAVLVRVAQLLELVD